MGKHRPPGTRRPSGSDRRAARGGTSGSRRTPGRAGGPPASATDEFYAHEDNAGEQVSYQLHILVNQDSRAYIVDAAQYVSASRCQLFTTVTPTNGETATAG